MRNNNSDDILSANGNCCPECGESIKVQISNLLNADPDARFVECGACETTIRIGF